MFKGRKAVALLLCVCFSLSLITPSVFATETTQYATREYIVSEFVQSVGRSNLEESSAVLEMFSDADAISEEYRSDLSRAIVGGILKGYDDHTLRPTEPVSRIEAMVMLARSVPTLSATEEKIEFTDVPEWATAEIDYLSAAGLVKGYGDGTMGADDFITVEQVGLLVERSDEALRTVAPGDSFYGYVNEKTFRNAVLENTTTIDPIHGAVVTNQNSWSHFNDVYYDIVDEEEEILNKLIDGELERPEGSTEQRVYDMLHCIDANIAASESDKRNIVAMREAVMNAKSAEELLDITSEVYRQTGINLLFDVSVDLDAETGLLYPSFTLASVGEGGFLAFRESTNTDRHKNVYVKLLDNYLSETGASFTEKELLDAIEYQAACSRDLDYFTMISTYLTFAQAFGLIEQEDLEAEIDAMIERHPELYDEENDALIPPTKFFVSKNTEEADATYASFDLCEELTEYGFTHLEKIIVPDGFIAESEKNLISDKNLTSMKIQALLRLNGTLGISLSEKEDAALSTLNMFGMMVCISPTIEDLEGVLEQDVTPEDSEASDVFEETTGVPFDEGLLSATNLAQLRALLPNDIPLLYTKYYYDDEISLIMEQMFHDIWDAYEARFEANTWMKEETKKNAIKKLDNMLAVVAYPDNYTYPEITSPENGGTLFSNILSIKRHNLSVLIRCNEEKEFIRTQMLFPPDEVNACYIPILNTINVPAGILNPPFIDPNATYAQNLGSVGMIIAHEIGHAFDKTGALYDENGCERNWWTEEDYAEFQKIQNEFVEYYNRFEVVDGVVQDASITITENMADFAAMQVLMDIIGDDEQAQKECFEAYAAMWAQLGTTALLTDSYYMNDVHAANVVRVNAVLASFDQFYEIYDITEDDMMYVAPEDRLRLW